MFKTKITILLACAAGMAATSTVADAQGRGGQACFFERPDYRGRSFCVDAGRETPRLSRDWDDRISSIEIDRRVIVEICERPGFRGRCQVFDRSVPNLGRRGDNRISSFRVDRSQRRPVARACFYDRPDFRGRQFCAEAGEVGNRLPPGWDNRISSIRLEGDAVAQVCPFPGLNGRCRIVDRDMRFVGRDLNDRISSYRVDDDDRRGVGRGGRDGRAGAPPGIDDRLPPRQRAGDDERQGRGGRDGGRDGRGGRGGAPDGRDRRGGDDLAGAPDGGGRGGSDDRTGSPPAEHRVCFFEDANLAGRELCVNAGETLDRLPRGFDDAISSMRNWGRAVAQVCDRPGLRGECRVYDSTETYVGDRWNDRFSSIRVGRK